MNKMMKVSMVVALSLVTVLSMGAVKVSAATQGCWRQYPDGKWYYFKDGAFEIATNTVIDGKYRVDSNGVWDGITMDSSANQVTQSNSNVAQTNTIRNSSTVQTIDNNTISYEEFTKIADDTMLNLVNAHRKENGLNALEWDPTLAATSTEKCQHNIEHNYIGHVYKGIMTVDVQTIAWKYNIDGENALTRSTSYSTTKLDAINMATTMFNQWKASPGHDATMLREDFVKFGFGFGFSNGKADYASYGVQQFAWKHNGYENNLILPEGFPTSLKVFN